LLNAVCASDKLGVPTEGVDGVLAPVVPVFPIEPPPETLVGSSEDGAVAPGEPVTGAVPPVEFDVLDGVEAGFATGAFEEDIPFIGETDGDETPVATVTGDDTVEETMIVAVFAKFETELGATTLVGSVEDPKDELIIDIGDVVNSSRFSSSSIKNCLLNFRLRIFDFCRWPL
jgi:hypothetical protein